MFKAISAFSDDIDSKDAIEEILADCDRQLRGMIPAAGLLFPGTEFEHKVVLNSITQHFQDIQLS